MKVRFAKPAGKKIVGLQIALDYPESKVGVPGSAGEAQTEARVSDVSAFFFQVNDADYEIAVTATNAPEEIPAGDFFTVQLDNCIGASRPVALAEFGCAVLQATDDLDNIVTNQVTCSVVAP